MALTDGTVARRVARNCRQLQLSHRDDPYNPERVQAMADALAKCAILIDAATAILDDGDALAISDDGVIDFYSTRLRTLLPLWKQAVVKVTALTHAAAARVTS